MEDIFETRKDKEEVFVFRYPFYERYLFVLGIASAAASVLARNRIHDQFKDSVWMECAAFGLIGLFVAACLWISFRAWQSKVIASPTALKAKYLFQGIERVSWDHIAEVVYKWRLLGHGLVFLGTDGSRVRIRSSISNYEKLLRIIRTNAPAPILDQLDDVLGEEDEEEEEKEPAAKVEAEQAETHAEPPKAEEDMDEVEDEFGGEFEDEDEKKDEDAK